MNWTVKLQQVERRADEVRTPGEAVPGVERVAVIRGDKLGDFVLTLPAIAAIHDTYPEARLAVAVNPAVAPLAAICPIVDEVLTSPDRDGGAALRRYRPDLVVCIERGWPAAIATWRSGARHRVGSARRLWSVAFPTTVRESRRGGGRHEAEYGLSFAHRVGAPAGPARFPLQLDDADRSAAQRWRQQSGVEGPFVLLHPGSGGSCPRWPLERYGDLIAVLSRAGRPVVLSAGPEDDAVARALVRDPATSLPVFQGSLGTLAALLDSAAVVVSNSTGPLHLAAALETPTLALHAPWSGCAVPRWGPYSPRGYGLVAEPDRPVPWSRKNRRRLGEQALAALTVERVAAIATALADGEEPR